MAGDNGPPMTITMVVCTVASFLFMSLRFYCKQALSTKLGLDDAVLAFSWVCARVSAALGLAAQTLQLTANLVFSGSFSFSFLSLSRSTPLSSASVNT